MKVVIVIIICKQNSGHEYMCVFVYVICQLYITLEH